MRSLATLFLIALFLTTGVSAQPLVRYMIPDIGAPGMNTYVEIIGPWATFQNFGVQDVEFDNGRPELTIEPANAADNTRIVCGPAVVSWEGRMISTQIFVRPGAATGPCPIIVRLNGVASAPIPFEIINPQPLTLSGNNTLGTGARGTANWRSPRGAMIVSSLNLGAGTYTVNRADLDAAAPGIQGYLPFVLISRGPVTLASGVTLDLNATGRDGGPGGGGGAGQVCDGAIFGGGGAAGTAGGNGYTGGALGGRNDRGQFPSAGPSVLQPNGTGTGTSQANFSESMNGAPGGRSVGGCWPESGGGGTGHPFGDGGTASCGGSERGAAGHGGAGGSQNNSAGAGGSYGGNGGASGGNAGLRHGNIHGVPLAGGSGGSAGNPQGSSICAGEGGGGGGAVALFSQERMVWPAAAVTVRGGNGGNGAQGGGGGSGGMAIVGAKDTLATGGNLFASAGVGGNPGGGNGGQGRLRWDGYPALANEPSPNDFASRFIGPTIDTLSYVDKATFRLWGTHDGNSDMVVWIKGDNAFPTWTRLAGPGATTRVTRPAGMRHRWYLDITLPARGYYFIVAGQEEATENLDRWERTPQYVLSQAAANIIFADLIPKINRDTVKFVRDIICERSVLDSIPIVNTGDADLVVQAPSIVPASDFNIVDPTIFPLTLPAGRPTDTVWVKFLFAPTTPGTKTATFTFLNNDPRIDNDPLGTNPRDPFVVQVTGRRMRFEPRLSTTTISLPDVCVDSTSESTLQFFWNTDSTGSIVSIVPMEPGPFSIVSPTAFPTSPRTPAGGNLPITVRFRPTASGTFSQRFRVTVSPCDTPLVFTATGRAVQSNIAVTPDPIDFADVPVGTSSSQASTVANNGTATSTIREVFFVPNLPELSQTGMVGRTLQPGQSLDGNVTYAPTVPGALPPDARMCVVFSGACPDTVCVPLVGRAITSMLTLTEAEVTLRAEPCADPAPDVTTTFTLANLGAAPEQITSIASDNGLVTVTSLPTVPAVLLPGERIIITVRWTPGAPGTQTDVLRVRSNSPDPNQRELVSTITLIRERSAIDVRDSAGNAVQTPVDFGSLLDCDLAKVQRFLVRGVGTMTEQVAVRMVDGSAFSVTPSPAFTVDAGAEVVLNVRFGTGSTGEFFDTLVVRNELCDTEFRIPVTGRRSGLQYTYPPLAFGQSNVGFTTTGTMFFRFDSTTSNDVRAVVTGAFIRNGGSVFAITRSSFPASLAPNELTTVEISFTPDAEIPYNAELCWIVESPCADTLCAPITGEGIRSNLLVRRTTLDFGSHFICQDSTLDLVIENTGTAPVNIQGLNLGGTDPGAFSQTTPVTLPTTLAPGGVLTVSYRFDPSAVATDGVKTATVTIVSDDPVRREIVVTLLGERRRQAIQSPAGIDFGTVAVGEFAEQDLFLFNRTEAPLVVTALDIPAPFTIVSPGLPVVIPPLPGSITVRVRYTPTDSFPSSADLIARYSEPCVDSSVIPVVGRGRLILTGNAALVVPDSLKGAPGDRIAIPIILERGTLIKESDATTFRATVRFNRHLLYPTAVRSGNDALPKPVTGAAVSAGQILSSTIEGEDRVLTFEVTNDPMPTAPDTIAFIDATVLLGDRLTTPIAFDTLSFTNGRLMSVAEDGLFTLIGYCEVGGNRLVRITGAAGIKGITPNPFNPTAEITFETSESGPTSLTVYDMAGNVVERLVDAERIPVGPHVATWSALAYPSGVYYIELRTPTERSIERAVLVK